MLDWLIETFRRPCLDQEKAQAYLEEQATSSFRDIVEEYDSFVPFMRKIPESALLVGSAKDSLGSDIPVRLNPEVPDGLSAILRKLLAKNPGKRYPNAKALLEDITKLRRGEDPDALASFGKFLKCGFCETLNPVGTRKCKICNEPLAEKHASGLHLALRDDEFMCADCKGVNTKGSRSCSQCSRLFCPKCGVKTVTEEDRTCGLCAKRSSYRR